MMLEFLYNNKLVGSAVLILCHLQASYLYKPAISIFPLLQKAFLDELQNFSFVI